MTAPKTFGDEFGTGLGAFAQQFVGTQNTIQQQQQALVQQQRDNQYRDQQAAAALTQNNFANDYNNRQLAEQQKRDAAVLAQTDSTKRQADFTSLVLPSYNGEMEDLAATLKAYGPNSANYNPGMVAHAVARQKQLKKLMSAVSMTTATGEGFDEAKRALLTFVGTPDETGTVPPTPGTSAQVQPQVAPQPIAPLIDMSFTPPRATVAHGDAVANGDPAPQAGPNPAMPAPTQVPVAQVPQVSPPAPMSPVPAPTAAAPAAAPTAAPPSVDLSTYKRIQDVPIGVLMTADDRDLVKQFGEGNPDAGIAEYAQARRTAYKTQQDTARAAAIAAQNKLWDAKLTAIQTDTVNPASPAQVTAANTITGLNARMATGVTLTPEENTQYQQAVLGLARDVYTPKAWQDVLNSKDDTQITAMYKVFKQMAPDIIPPSFDITPYQARLDDAHDTARATVDRETATRTSSDQTAAIQLTLGGASSIGDVIAKKDTVTLRRVAADPAALKLLGYTDGHLLTDAANEIDRGSQAGTDKVTQDNSLKLLLGGASSVSDVISKNDSTTLRRLAGDPAALKLLGYSDGHLLTLAANEIDRGTKAATDKVVAGTTSVDDANKIKTLLGGSSSVAEVISKGDSATLRRVAQDPAGLQLLGYADGGHSLRAAANGIDQRTTAVTNKTVAEMLGANASAGSKLLAQLSAYSPNMTYAQIVKGSGGASGIVANLKHLLGVNDNGAANLIQQAQYQYGLGLRGKDLLNKLSEARIDTQTAIQGNYAASTAQTTALTPVKVSEGTARTTLAVAQTGVANATAGQITQLTPVKVGEGNARIDQITSAITDNRNRANAYVDGVRKGTLQLDAAHIALLNQQTLAYKMKNPTDPLYDPNFAHAASGTYYGDLAKKAALYTSQANLAAKQVSLIQKSIATLTANAKLPFGGGIDLSKLSADDQKKLVTLNTHLTRQMDIVAHRSASADQVISDGLKGAPQPAQPAPGRMTAAPGFRSLTDTAAATHGVNPQYLYGFLGAESSGGRNTANYKGLDYQGVGQIGAAAAADVNKTFGLNLDRGRPEDNIQIAALYMKKQLATYGGDPVKAYAAYNMGPGNFNAYLKANGGKINMATLPAETRTGIGNLKGYMAGYRQDGSPGSTPVITTTGTNPAATTTPAKPAAPAAGKPGTWGPPSAALPAGVKVVGSASQFAQDLRQRGWFTVAAAAKDAPTLQHLIQQATAQVLPTGTAEQRLALQRDLWDSVAGN